MARSKPELRKGLLDLIDVMGPMRKILGVLCPSDTIAQPTFRELLGDLQVGVSRPIIANPGTPLFALHTNCPLIICLCLASALTTPTLPCPPAPP